MSSQPALPFLVFPSQEAKKLGWDGGNKYVWPGKAVHTGTTITNKVVTQFLLRQREDGLLVLKTWQSDMLVPFIPEEVDSTPQQVESLAPQPLTSCAAARDGECHHKLCPQIRDNEPYVSGRHCPLDHGEDDY